MKMNARELREAEAVDIEGAAELPRNQIYLILENVYDTYNVGGLFRLADGVAAAKMYLCGQTEFPPNSKIKKASIGTYKIVPWEYKATAAEAIADLRSRIPNVRIIAIEQSEQSKPYTEVDYARPVAFLVGNETSGVEESTLKLCDEIAEIPMWGVNKSLNVIVSAAIVVYRAMLGSTGKLPF